MLHKQDNEISIGSYSAIVNFLKYCIAEFNRSNVEFAPLFKTEKLLVPVDTELEEIDLLNEGPVSEPEFRYIYKRKNSEKKEFFKARQSTWFTPVCFGRLFPKLPSLMLPNKSMSN